MGLWEPCPYPFCHPLCQSDRPCMGHCFSTLSPDFSLPPTGSLKAISSFISLLFEVDPFFKCPRLLHCSPNSNWFVQYLSPDPLTQYWYHFFHDCLFLYPDRLHSYHHENLKPHTDIQYTHVHKASKNIFPLLFYGFLHHHNCTYGLLHTVTNSISLGPEESHKLLHIYWFRNTLEEAWIKISIIYKK